MAGQKYISMADLPGWLAGLTASNTVLVPQREGKAVVYRPYTEGCTPEFNKKPTESVKHAVFPRSEVLFNFHKKRTDDNTGNVVSLETPEDPTPMVVFGALPCDVRGFLAFDPVYNGCGTAGLAKDVYYLKRREKTVLVSKACKTMLSTCFCNWVGAGPAGSMGTDVLATDIEGGFVLNPITDKGKELVSTLADAEQSQEDAAVQAHEKILSAMKKGPDLSLVKEALLKVFDDTEFWQAQSSGCLSCGGCTYLCPTCYCFNITDESNGISGTRIRSWDNCMAPLFTLEASSHNPRAGKAARLRNRVGHKFSYYPNLHEGRFSCVGCGRCIKSCPSGVDIRKIVLNAIAQAEKMKEAANG